MSTLDCWGETWISGREMTLGGFLLAAGVGAAGAGLAYGAGKAWGTLRSGKGPKTPGPGGPTEGSTPGTSASPAPKTEKVVDDLMPEDPADLFKSPPESTAPKAPQATPKKYPAFPKANAPVKAPATEQPVPPIDKAGEFEARPPEALDRIQAEQLCRSGGCKIPSPNHPLLQQFKPTQSARKVNWGKVAEYADRMRRPASDPNHWNWNPDTAIAVDPNGAIVGGHHRVLAAAVAGVPIPQSYIYVVKSVTARDVISWHEVFGL